MITATLLLCPVIGLVFARHMTMRPFAVVVVTLSSLTIGYLESPLDTANIGWRLTLGFMSVVAGYSVTALVGTRPKAQPGPGLLKQSITSAVALNSLLVVYHFGRTGIPLLSANLETARFDFTSSGFFGIPGRAYLFGAPLVAAMCLRYRVDLPVWVTRVGVGTFVVSRLLSGFKSSLLEILVLLFFVRSSRTESITVGAAVRRFAPGALAAIAFAAVVLTLYTGPSDRSMNSLQTLTDRATLDAAAPGLIANRPDSDPLPGQVSLLQDGKYFAKKYAGVGSGADSGLSFSQLVSVKQYNTPVTSQAFIVPVTVGGPAVFVHDFGMIGGTVLLSGVGCLFRLTECWTNLARRPTSYLGSFSSMFAIYLGLTKGDWLHAIINVSAMVVFLIGAMIAPSILTVRAGAGFSSTLKRRTHAG